MNKTKILCFAGWFVSIQILGVASLSPELWNIPTDFWFRVFSWVGLSALISAGYYFLYMSLSISKKLQGVKK